MNPMAPFAMLGLAKLFLFLMFIGTGIVIVGGVVFLAIRSESNSIRLQRRIEELERQIRELRRPRS